MVEEPELSTLEIAAEHSLLFSPPRKLRRARGGQRGRGAQGKARECGRPPPASPRSSRCGDPEEGEEVLVWGEKKDWKKSNFYLPPIHAPMKKKKNNPAPNLNPDYTVERIEPEVAWLFARPTIH